MKAFLSHSSHDKEFVRSVASELGRQFCIFDEQAFETGTEFKESIEHGLDESSIFVFFASRKSLASLWVEFEIEEAWFRRLQKVLDKSIVYIIDGSVEINKFPEWMQRALVSREISPKIIARDIRYHLDELLRERQHIFFYGRSSKIEELGQALTPFDGSHPPHVVFITGLPGIGRKSLVRHTAPRILNLRKYVPIRLGEGHSTTDICISIASLIEPYSTKEGFERIIDKIRNLSIQEACNRTLINLRAIVAKGELPVMIDEGGFLDNDGYIREPIKTIIQSLEPNDEAYIFFISVRKPQQLMGLTIPVIHLEPLFKNESKHLISLLANRAELSILPTEIDELADYVAGYPPSAYFAIQQAKYYGLELLMRDKARLVQFRTSVFLKHFAKISLDENDQALLRLLAIYSPLPLSVISNVVSIDLEKIYDKIIYLIDLALILTTEEGYYRIADPVADAAINAFGFPSEEQHKKLAKSLYDYIKESIADTAFLDLSRVLFRAARWAKDDMIARGAIYLSNDLIRLTESSYHAGKYEETLTFGKAALAERPDSVTARRFFVRALIQNEEWQEAGAQIQELKKYDLPREVYFLTGFLERRRNNIPAAVSAYLESEGLGKRGAAINRELGLCYHLMGDNEKAFHYIKEALAQHGDNRYIVDLFITIATQQGNEAAARKELSRLELIDRPLFYYHRLSRVELYFGRLDEARNAAEKAFKCETWPNFEVIAQFAYCEIGLGNIPEAEQLINILDNRFGKILHDIRTSLRCNLEIARKHYGEALDLSNLFKDSAVRLTD